MKFEHAVERVLGAEGGYVNDPSDPGGETNWGVTWSILREAISLGLLPASTTIADLSREQAKLVYRELFWNHIHADELFDGVAYQALDFAVSSGIGTAIRKLQVALGVADDGRWGPVSIAAEKAMGQSDQIMRFNAERLDFMRKLKNWPSAGRGWAGRIAQNLRYGAIDS